MNLMATKKRSEILRSRESMKAQARAHKKEYKTTRIDEETTIKTTNRGGTIDMKVIRKVSPRECYKLSQGI